MREKSLEEIIDRIQKFVFKEKFDTIVAIANGGIIPAALINQRLQCDFHLIKINLRNAQQQPIYDKPKLLEPLHFDPKNRTILLVEDRIKTGASVIFAKELLQTALQIKTFAVNGNADYYLYHEACFKFPWIM